MELIDILRGKRVYFDTNIFIYLFEGTPKYQYLIDVLASSLSKNEFQVSSSFLTFTEILPPLVRKGDEKILSETLDFLRDSGFFTFSPVDEDICIQAGVFRGELRMKTPDALHVATSIHQGCDIFLTNDAGIRVPRFITRVLLSDYC